MRYVRKVFENRLTIPVGTFLHSTLFFLFVFFKLHKSCFSKSDLTGRGCGLETDQEDVLER